MTEQAIIYIGASNRAGVRTTTEEVARVVSHYFEGATITDAIGLWQGKRETCVTVTLLDTDLPHGFITRVGRLARMLKSHFIQEAVLVTISEVQAELI